MRGGPRRNRPNPRRIPWRTTTAGVLVLGGPQWSDWFGAAWQSRLAEFHDWIDPRDVDRFLRTWREANHHRMPVIVPCRWTHPDGSVWRCTTRAMPVADGRIFTGYVGESVHTRFD